MKTESRLFRNNITKQFELVVVLCTLEELRYSREECFTDSTSTTARRTLNLLLLSALSERISSSSSSTISCILASSRKNYELFKSMVV